MDSDDYFDDIVLDDQTLAVLDSVEQNFLTQTVPPPAKRQKTDKGWKPVPAQGRASVVDDNDLPEISVHGDGTYGLGESNSTLNPPTVPSSHQRVGSVPTVPRVAPHTRPQPPPRPRDSFPQSTTRNRAYQPPHERVPQQVVASDISQAEELRKQLEELQRENRKYLVDLKDARDAKFAKQGEVAILRQGIEKTAQDHATQVAMLKLAKEESEAKQIALQKEMKAEMERLKAQFMFKQLELESSSRKPPLSVRSKRIAKDVPSTPLAVPSQIKGWNRNAGFPEQSPVRTRVVHGSPQGVHTRRTPEKSKKPPKLLGFQNSFIDATPVRSVHSRFEKEETETHPARHREISTSPILFPQQLADIKMTELRDFADDLIGPETSDTERPRDDGTFTDDLEEIKPFNWKAELTRIILTHSFSSNTSPTLKTLAGLALPPESAEEYSRAVTRILELVASTAQNRDYEASLWGVCRYLTSMIVMLNSTNLENELAALLNLLVCLSCSLPMFAPSLLALSHEKGDDYDLLEALCSIIQNHLDPSKHTQPGSALGGETVGLLEGLCWNVKDELIGRLAMICNRKDILIILLDALQPSWLIGRSIRLLVFLATHPRLSRDLLSSTEKPLSDGAKAKDNTKLPHIERLCSYLIDASRKDPEAADMKSQILTFFGILSVAHPDIHATLVGCQAVIPSLVAFSTQMTTLLWEGDEFFITCSETIARTIRTLNQTLFLIHHLVFGLEPNFNLRQRLHYAPSRAFNGITHMFIVTFGRLSCADPPEWIDSAQKLELESMSEMAQDLLDLVVDGPEGDSIWTAYQVEPGVPGDGSDTDEEDMEAKLLGTGT